MHVGLLYSVISGCQIIFHVAFQNVYAYDSPNEQPAGEDAEQEHGIDVGEVIGGVHRFVFFG